MKIYCYIGNNPKLFAAVQEEAFAAGATWVIGSQRKRGGDSLEVYKEDFYLSFNENLGYSAKKHYSENGYDEVSIPEFIKRIKENAKKTFSVKLNEEYTATWKQGDDTLKAGCQTIKIDKVLELAKLIQENQK